MQQLDLSYNRHPMFTEWVVRHGLLASPLVIVDVGVQGGASVRWDHLADRVEIHGFDALEEAIAPLRAEGRPKRHYYATALGNEDGERELFVASELTASSFYPSGSSRYDIVAAVQRGANSRRVPVRRLDSLMTDGTIPRADFIKIDCEGFEPEILKGAENLLRTGVLAIEVETSFDVSTTVPETHFGAVYKQLLPHGFLLYDLEFNRIRRSSFVRRARSRGMKNLRTVARPATFNVLFYRDAPSSSADEALKRAIILELYGMVDSAYDILIANTAIFAGDVSIEEAADQLLRGARRWEIARHNSLTTAVRDSIYAISSAIRHSIHHRLGNRPRS